MVAFSAPLKPPTLSVLVLGACGVGKTTIGLQSSLLTAQEVLARGGQVGRGAAGGDSQTRTFALLPMRPRAAAPGGLPGVAQYQVIDSPGLEAKTFAENKAATYAAWWSKRGRLLRATVAENNIVVVAMVVRAHVGGRGAIEVAQQLQQFESLIATAGDIRKHMCVVFTVSFDPTTVEGWTTEETVLRGFKESPNTIPAQYMAWLREAPESREARDALATFQRFFDRERPLWCVNVHENVDPEATRTVLHEMIAQKPHPGVFTLPGVSWRAVAAKVGTSVAIAAAAVGLLHGASSSSPLGALVGHAASLLLRVPK